jgi:hypothetical protein
MLALNNLVQLTQNLGLFRIVGIKQVYIQNTNGGERQSQPPPSDLLMADSIK